MDLSNDGAMAKKRGRGGDFAHRLRRGCADGLRNSLQTSMSSIEVWRSAAAEFVATFILVFITCVSSINLDALQDSKTTKSTDGDATKTQPLCRGGDQSLQESAAISLSYATLIQCFEHISGGHMNPAISLAMFASGHISLFRALLHIIFQLSGAIIAVLLFYGVAPGEKDRIGDTFPHLHPGLAAWQGFFIEFIQGVLLSVAWLSSTTSAASSSSKEGDGATKRAAGSGTASGGPVAVVVGFALLANSLWANALTGASVNPARCVAPIIFFRTFDATLWVYIAGPIIGCVAGAVLYQQLFVTLPQSGGVLVLGGGLTTSDSSSSGGSECGGVTQIRSVEGKRDDDVTSFGNGDDVTAAAADGMFVASMNNHHNHVIHDQQQQQQRAVYRHRFTHHRFSALPTTNHQHLVQMSPASAQNLHHHPHPHHHQHLVAALQQPLVPTTTAASSVHRTMTPMRLNVSVPAAAGAMLTPPTPQSSSTASSRRIVVRGEVNAVAASASGGENEQLIGNSDL